MPGATVFSNGYWQIQLDEESSNLTAYNTPFGRYRYLRTPFGIFSASEIWQRSMEEEFGDIEGAEIIVDDLVVWGGGGGGTRMIRSMINVLSKS